MRNISEKYTQKKFREEEADETTKGAIIWCILAMSRNEKDTHTHKQIMRGEEGFQDKLVSDQPLSAD